MESISKWPLTRMDAGLGVSLNSFDLLILVKAGQSLVNVAKGYQKLPPLLARTEPRPEFLHCQDGKFVFLGRH